MVPLNFSFWVSVPEKYNNKGGPGIPILVVSEPESPPTKMSLFVFWFIRNLKISMKVKPITIRLIPSFNLFISINRKVIIPTGRPIILPAANLLRIP